MFLRDFSISRLLRAPEGEGAGGGAAAGPGAGSEGGNSNAAVFLDQIPEDIRGEAAFKDIKDLPGLARSYLNGQKMLGVPQDQILRLAGPDDAEGWSAIWNRLGRPETADKYQLADPAEIPEGLELNPEAKADFAKAAHELGLSQKQAAALYGKLNADRIAGYSKTLAGLKSGIAARDAALKAEWGAAHEQKQQDAVLAVAQLADKQGLGDRLQQAIDATPGDNGIAVKKAFAEMGRQMREDGIIKGDGGQAAGGALAPAEARQQIAASQADPQFMKAYTERNAPGHAEAVAKMTKLYEFAYPAQVAA